MPGDLEVSDELRLHELAYRYAAAVDACDVEAFTSVFAVDACLRSYHPDTGEPFADLTGHDQLASVPNSMRGMFRRTTHMMMNHLLQPNGDGATGSLLCTARHLLLDEPAVLVVVLRYLDRYARVGGSWLIADREIRFLWSERHQVVDSGF